MQAELNILRIATRESPLALWQAGHVKSLLQAAHPGLAVELVAMTTTGDQLLDRSLATVGGKGLFVKELEAALLEGRADLAVHSMKDVPAQLPPGLCLAVYLPGEDPRDVLVSSLYPSLAALPPGAVVGTASLRRQAQLRILRRDLVVRELRGNVGTRLRKLDEGHFDAILLARAGLVRLGLESRIRESFAVNVFVPAIAQGVIGIECREQDAATRSALAPLHDVASATRLAAERALGARLGGACTVPVAGHATLHGDRLRLNALVAAPDGSRVIRGGLEGAAADAAAIGDRLGHDLLAGGAKEILAGLGIGTGPAK
jgi:hydroxymethylbilane synthase